MLLKSISLISAGLILVVALIFIIPAEIIKEEYVLLQFKYSNGNFSLINKSLEKGYYPHEIYDRTYEFNLLSKNNENLYATTFEPSLLYSDGGEQLDGGVLILDEAVFFVAMPNYKEINKVRIVKDNQTIFEEDIHDVGSSSCRIA